MSTSTIGERKHVVLLMKDETGVIDMVERASTLMTIANNGSKYDSSNKCVLTRTYLFFLFFML